MPIPLPPLPPTAGNSLANLSGIDAERLIVRAVSLDDNWRSEAPRAFRIRGTPTFGADEVLEMTMLPGGKYLVTSSAVLGRVKHCLTLYTMDHPSGTAQPFAQFPTETKACSLHAKYMTWRGKPGIMISYVRRMLQNPERDWIYK